MPDELKPCPFCGTAPERLESGIGGTGLMLHCIAPDCPNPSVSYYDHASALAVWNRRAPAVPVTGWQPIETAPRDGVVIDLWFAGSGWDCRVSDCFWSGEYWFRKGYGGYNDDPKIITHWQPLPAPPAVAGKEGGG